MNVISTLVVTKFEFKAEHHLRPSKVAWVDRTSFPVTQCCLVSLKLGPFYLEGLYCDILSMNVAHILLGPSWLYDHNVKHFRRENIYEFIHQGKFIRNLSIMASLFGFSQPNLLTLLKNYHSRQNPLVLQTIGVNSCPITTLSVSFTTTGWCLPHLTRLDPNLLLSHAMITPLMLLRYRGVYWHHPWWLIWWAPSYTWYSPCYWFGPRFAIA